MAHAHAHDPAQFPPTEEEMKNAFDNGGNEIYGNGTQADLPAPPTLQLARKMSTAFLAQPPAGGPAGGPPPQSDPPAVIGDPTNIPPEQDPTHAAFAPPPTHPPPFCEAQMCAPYPATWIKGGLMAKLVADGHLDACPLVDPGVADTHPRGLYDDTMSEPVPPPTTADMPPPAGSAVPPAPAAAAPAGSDGAVPTALVQGSAPNKMVVRARQMAIARRQRSWAWTAARAAGVK